LTLIDVAYKTRSPCLTRAAGTVIVAIQSPF
jgi:hypothetical protein